MPSISLQSYKMASGDTYELADNLNDIVDIVEASVNALLAGYSAGFDMQGFHDASTAAYPGTPSQGDAWVIDTAGTISAVAYVVGDIILYDGSTWLKNPGFSGASIISTLTIGNITFNGANITSDTNAIGFGSSGLSTTGSISGGAITGSSGSFTGNVSAGTSNGYVTIGTWTSSSIYGAISFAGASGLTSSIYANNDGHLQINAASAGEIRHRRNNVDVFTMGSENKILNNTIIGSPSVVPDGTLHVYSGSAGSVSAPFGALDLTIESNTSGGSTVLTPDASYGQYSIGSVSLPAGAYFDWSYDVGVSTYSTAKVGAEIRLRPDAGVTNLTLSGASGSETAKLEGGLALSGATPTAGGGIAFPATQVASADANTLDDYEEGTFTPTWVPASGSGQTVATAVGVYTKIGNRVFIDITLATNGHGTASGNLSIGGLPFTSSATTNQISSLTCGQADSFSVTAGQSVSARVNYNATTITPILFDATSGSTTLQVSEFGVSGTLRLSGSYEVA